MIIWPRRLELKQSMGKWVHMRCENATVKNRANRFSFQKANLPISIHNGRKFNLYGHKIDQVKD